MPDSGRVEAANPPGLERGVTHRFRAVNPDAPVWVNAAGHHLEVCGGTVVVRSQRSGEHRQRRVGQYMWFPLVPSRRAVRRVDRLTLHWCCIDHRFSLERRRSRVPRTRTTFDCQSYAGTVLAEQPISTARSCSMRYVAIGECGRRTSSTCRWDSQGDWGPWDSPADRKAMGTLLARLHATAGPVAGRISRVFPRHAVGQYRPGERLPRSSTYSEGGRL